MSKERAPGKKAGKKPKGPDKKPAKAKGAAEGVSAAAVPGQRLYDMPYGSAAPLLVNPDLGLANLIARAGSNAGYDIDLTLLDAADHRLLRSGVLLAHRVLDGRGEWYLGAPDWVPLLPEERIESMSHADLSEEFADLIRPFRRRAPLSPVAAMECQRRQFALRSRDGSSLALLRDDRVTVRRGGLTVARYREVVLTPVGPGLDERQIEWLDHCFVGAGATRLNRLPRLVHRLGAPATGASDFGEPAPFAADAPFGGFVSSLIAMRSRALLTADLRIRSGDTSAALEWIRTAETLSRELEGLRSVLDHAWAADLIDELDWLAAVPVRAEETSEELIEQVSARLRGERYLSLLDRLVAARGVRLGDIATQPSEAILAALATDQLAAVDGAVARLAVDGPPGPWATAWLEFERTAVVDSVVAHLRPEEVERRQRRMGRCRPLLAEVRRLDAAADDALLQIEAMTPSDAFNAGREFERNRETAQTARSEFLVAWAKARRKLSA